MIKPRSQQQELWVPQVEVQREFPDCRYSKISAIVGDWRALAKPVEAAFARGRGRPVDPVVYLKIFLVGALEGTRYDTELATRIDDSKRIRRFLGFSLTEKTPDHSTISWAREKISKGCDLEPLLEAIVERCLAAGLGDGSVTAVDATLIPANASLDSLRHVETGLSAGDHFRQVNKMAAEKAAAEKAAEETAAAKSSEAPAPAIATASETATAIAAASKVTEPSAGLESQAQPVVEAETPACGTCPEPETTPPAKVARRKLSNTEFVSLTDSEARIAKKHDLPADLCYQATTMVDQDQIIVAVQVSHANQGEVEAAREVVEQGLKVLSQRAGPAPFVLADKGYDAASFHQHVEEHGGVPLTYIRTPSETKPEALRKAHFTYLPDIDAYRCPNAKLLPFRAYEPQRERSRYHSNAVECADCPLRQQCLDEGAKIRTITRAKHEESRERAVARAQTEPAKEMLKQRLGMVEGPFGFCKQYGGLALINCRGLAKAKVKVMFGAVTWNLLRLLHHLFQDPRREGSKQHRAAHQERRRLAKAINQKGDTVDSPCFGPYSPSWLPVQALHSLICLLSTWELNLSSFAAGKHLFGQPTLV